MDIKEAEKLAKKLSGNYWNYRWLKIVDEWSATDIEGKRKHYTDVRYELHEVYYDTENKPFMFTDQPVKFVIEEYSDMMQLIDSALAAGKEKVLLLSKDDTLIEIDEYMEGL